MALKIFFQLSFWLCLVGVLYLSLSPLTIASGIQNGDKIGHAMCYAILFGLAAKSYSARVELWLLATCAMLFGMLMEWAQSQTNYRQADSFDMMANGLGILTMWLLIVFRRKLNKR